MHDAGRGEEHITAIPKIAYNRIEHPFAADHYRSVECHRKQCDQNIGER